MDGVVLFADNKIFLKGKEKTLFELFLQKKDFSILPIDNLSCLEATIRSASTFKACIIDWNFENIEIDDEDFGGIQHVQRTPMSILLNYSIFTLIYIYSEVELSEEDKLCLKEKYGKKIHFRKKGNDVDKEYQYITKAILKFERENPHLEIPFLWSQTINTAAQSLFEELENADQNWIKEFRDTVIADGGDPTTELIDIFNNVLSESIVQSPVLRSALDNYNVESNSKSVRSTAKVYQRLIYSQMPSETSIMTGELFRFKRNLYGILITPECEIKDRFDKQLEFLIFRRSNFKEYLVKNYSYTPNDNYETFKENRKKRLKQIFNNDSLSTQILPVFPFSSRSYNEVACIDFKTAFCIKRNKEYVNKRMLYRLNAPYIHQLRQRFVSYFGKYGVPAIPDSLREYNLKK